MPSFSNFIFKSCILPKNKDFSICVVAFVHLVSLTVQYLPHLGNIFLPKDIEAPEHTYPGEGSVFFSVFSAIYFSPNGDDSVLKLNGVISPHISEWIILRFKPRILSLLMWYVSQAWMWKVEVTSINAAFVFVLGNFHDILVFEDLGHFIYLPIFKWNLRTAQNNLFSLQMVLIQFWIKQYNSIKAGLKVPCSHGKMKPLLIS